MVTWTQLCIWVNVVFSVAVCAPGAQLRLKNESRGRGDSWRNSYICEGNRKQGSENGGGCVRAVLDASSGTFTPEAYLEPSDVIFLGSFEARTGIELSFDALGYSMETAREYYNLEIFLAVKWGAPRFLVRPALTLKGPDLLQVFVQRPFGASKIISKTTEAWCTLTCKDLREDGPCMGSAWQRGMEMWKRFKTKCLIVAGSERQGPGRNTSLLYMHSFMQIIL